MSTVSTLPAGIQSRLDYLRTLNDGTYGSKIPEVSIQLCEKILQQLPPELLTKVIISPIPDGDIDLSWYDGIGNFTTCCIFKDASEDDFLIWIHNHNRSISKEFKFEQLSESASALIELLQSIKQ